MNPTPLLRFVTRRVIAGHEPEMDPTYKDVRILQQWWSKHLPYGIVGESNVLYDARVAYQQNMGEWRDVPLETEGHNQDSQP